MAGSPTFFGARCHPRSLEVGLEGEAEASAGEQDFVLVEGNVVSGADVGEVAGG